MTQREKCLENIKFCRKKYGRNSKEVYQSIYKTVKNFPLYKGHLEEWLNKNSSYICNVIKH